jgi:hypothetical protein
MLRQPIVKFVLVCLLVCIAVDKDNAQAKRGIRSVDFSNFTYRLSGREKATLKNGKYKEKYEDFKDLYFTRELLMLGYADFNSDGNDEAVVLILSKDIGSGHGDYDYFVYEFVNGRARQIFHEYYEGGKRFRIQNRSLIISGESWNSDLHQPHCCPPFIETKVYRWRGSGLVLVKRYLKKQTY